jgi:hypothetical protein
VLKGRDNYLCVRKLMEILNAPSTLLSAEERDSFMALLPWAVTTGKGDIGECNSFSCARNRVLWSKLASTAASCLGEKCKYHAVCPALRAKREAVASNLLLVNHSLFLADLALDFALLPAYEHVVFDEAHRLPELSNQSFGRHVSFFRFRNVAKTLVPPKGVPGGLLAEIEKRIPAENDAAHAECTQLAADIGEAEKALAMLRFQEHLERLTWQQGNMKQTAPAQRMADFVNGRLSYDLPKSSYSPGLISSPLHFWLPPFISKRLQEGFKTFGKQAHGFLTNEAVMIAIETRTSAPVRIVRDASTLQHVRITGLFPCGEGAGYAGGIVSAGIDGERCADACGEYLSAGQ